MNYVLQKLNQVSARRDEFVAREAEQAANKMRAMIVVNRKATSKLRRIFPANGTAAFLELENFLIIFWGQAVFLEQTNAGFVCAHLVLRD